MKTAILVVLCAVASAGSACDDGASGTIGLGPGQERVVDDSLRLRFVGVSSDSRCVGEDCLWPGNAAVDIELAIATGPASPFTLNTYLDPKSVDFGGYVVTLVDLTPHEPSTTAGLPGSYRAYFEVTPRPPEGGSI